MGIRTPSGPSGICRSIAAVTMACLLVGSTAFSRSGLDDWQNVQDLQSGTQVVVKTVAREKFLGSLINATADSLSMNSDERGFPGRVTRRRSIPRGEVKEVRLWRRAASTLLGGAIGAGLGAAIGGAIEASGKSDEDRGVALTVLTGLGFGLGALIGRHVNIVKGRRVYVAASAVPSTPATQTPEDE